MANLFRILADAILAVVVKRKFQNTHAACRQSLYHAIQLFHRDAAQNRNQLFPTNCRQNLMMRKHAFFPSRLRA